MTNRINLALLIIEIDEGFDPEPYYCTERYPTIGHGFRIEALLGGLCVISSAQRR